LVELAFQDPDLPFGLQGIDKQYYEAAKIDAASWLKSSGGSPFR
jgi:hypothetical protein